MSGTEDFPPQNIRSLSEAIRTRSLSPVELINAALERVERWGGGLNAFTAVTAESALVAAQEAERAIRRGEYRGPLHGIPFTIKDLFHVNGAPLTAGSRFLEGVISDYDAEAVRRMREAGAVILGKTNLHEFAYGTTSSSSVFGPVRNPWNNNKIAGGSSGGSAAAVAMCMGSFSLGTDTGGSVRIPAALCGVAGLKPTYDRISRHGLLALAPSLDHVGILARYVEDIAIVLRAMEGTGGKRSGSVEAAGHLVDDLKIPEIRGLKFGFLDSTFQSASDEVRRICQDAMSVFSEAGATWVPLAIRGIDSIRDATYTILFAEAAATHRDRIKSSMQTFFPDVRERFEKAEMIPASEYVHALSVRQDMLREIDHLFETADLLVSPMVPIGAPDQGADTALVGDKEFPVSQITTANTREWNALGCPALSLPCGFTEEGLPVGLQIVGRRWDEEKVLSAGALYQRLTDWHCRLPPLD